MAITTGSIDGIFLLLQLFLPKLILLSKDSFPLLSLIFSHNCTD